MSDAQLRRLVNILAYMAAAGLLGISSVLASLLTADQIAGFHDCETWAPARPILISMLTVAVPALAMWVAANRPRIGSEQMAAQVNDLRKDGISRADMAVLPADELAMLRAEAARLKRIKPIRDARDAREADDAAAGRGLLGPAREAAP